MSNPTSTPNNAPSDSGGFKRLWHPGFWLSQLPYGLVLLLTLLGVAYTSLRKHPIVAYWEFLALVVGVVCIGTG